MNGTDKYNKDHLRDPKNRISLKYYKGYYLDKIYRKICYQTPDRVWMYPRLDERKPGHVLIFSHRQLVSVNERAIATEMLGPFIPKYVSPNKEITKVIQETKVGAKPKVVDKFQSMFDNAKSEVFQSIPEAAKNIAPRKAGRKKAEKKQFEVLDRANLFQNMFEQK